MRWISSDQIWKVFFEVPAEDYVHLADFHQYGICPTGQVAIGERAGRFKTMKRH
jgi:hypothetical protein